MKTKRGELDTYLTIFLVAFLFLNLVITFFYFFGSSKTSLLVPEIEKNVTRFSFFLEGTNESLNGNVFVGKEFLGETVSGDLVVKNSSLFRNKNLTFITFVEGENYSFNFEIPENIDDIDVMKYVISKEHFTVAYKEYLDDYSNISETHWGHMPLSYLIENPLICERGELERLNYSFNLISNLTNGSITFVESKTPDITVICSHLNDELESAKQCKNISVNKNITQSMFYEEGILNKSTERLVSTLSLGVNKTSVDYQVCFVNQSDVRFPITHLDAVGLAVPVMRGNLIINATIYLNLDEANVCSNNFPITEVHELLHVFGFDHLFEQETLPENISDSKLALMMQDIMSPWASCLHQRGGIQDKYVDCLNYIYSNGQINKTCSQTNMYLVK